MEPNREAGFGLWQFGDDCRDWVAARSLTEAVATYEAETGLTPDEYGPVREVEHLEGVHFSDPDDLIGHTADGKEIYRRYNGREFIRKCMADGLHPPSIVATTEY